MSKKIKFATIGTNFIVDWFASAVNASEVAEISAIYSRSLETAQSAKTRWGVSADLFDNLDLMLENGEIDAVYVASPNTLHFEQGKKVLQAKKHLLCEKPATMTLQEFETLEQIAKENSVIILEAMRCYHSSRHDTIKEKISSLGGVRSVDLSFCKYSFRYDSLKIGILENAFNKKFGGGGLSDIGVYPLSAMVNYFGKPNKIVASGIILPDSVDALGNINCEYDGFNVNISYSKINESYRQNEISGEKSSLLFFPLIDPKCGAIHSKDSVIDLNFGEIQQGLPNDMIVEVNDFARCVENHDLANEYNEKTKIVLALIDEARKQIGIDISCCYE